MSELLKRISNRLKDYNYSDNGGYFITICIKDRSELLGKVVGEAIGLQYQVKLSNVGIIVDAGIKQY